MKSQNELQELESILTFLGIEFIDNNGHRLTNGHKTAKTIGEIKAFFGKEVMTSGQFLKDIDWWDFKKNWNDLFFLVEKIKETQPFITFDLSFFGCEIKIVDFANDNSVLFSTYPKMNTQDTKMIVCVYNAVLNYIHWYNEYK